MSTRNLVVSLGCLLLAGAGQVDADVGDNSVGMNVHDGRQTMIDACQDLGVAWVRVDGNWFALEPGQDDYHWSQMDAAVDRAHAAGLQVYLTLAYTPSWVARHGDTDGLSHNDCPDDATHWVDFVQDAVNHYRARGVTHFGIWNEPNLDHFFEGTVDEYAAIIAVPGAQAVRTVCTDCVVLGPDLANVGEVDDYLEAIYDRVPVSTFDIVAHHIYQDFEETGWHIWDGDSFINALDDQRFPFTRRDLRQVLDAAGFQGEVWITETGYRASPPGDAEEEQLQAIYVTRVLEEQLARAWYTNTFFYEILDCGPDQPECTIDGYGLMRAVAGLPGSRTFPDDFRRKPAFDALKQFISAHPEITGTEPAAQCGDGTDNDGDGLTDLEDRGCSDAFDDDESDDPERPRIDAFRTNGIVLDGDTGDLGVDGWIDLGEEAWRGTDPLGAGDLAVRAAVRWNPDALYLAIEADDDVHQNDHAAPELWMGDSLQLAFDVGCNGGLGYDDTDDHEINFGLSGGQVLSFRFHGPDAASDAFEAAVERTGTRTVYEVRLAASALPGLDLQAGTLSGFSFLVNDADGEGRTGWIEWTRGVGTTKAPAYFGEILLRAETGGDPDEDGGPDGASDADGGADAGSDAGTDAGSDTGADAGVDAGRDAGSDPGADAGPGADARGDAGQATDDDQTGEAGSGCGCGGGRASGLAGLVVLALWAAGRAAWRRLLALLLLPLAGASSACGLDVVEITIEEEGQVGLAGVLLPGIGNFGSSLERALSDEDVDPGDVDSMKVLGCRLEMISQGGITNDLTFLEKMEFYLDADGMEQKLLAGRNGFTEGEREVDLDVTDDLELKPYLKAGGMSVSVDAPMVQPPPDLVEIRVTFRIRVNVDVA